MSRLQFQLQTTDGHARRGRLTFPRGTVETPAFMPVGTYGSVKGILPEQIRALGAEIILGNTFHLYLRPGLDVIGDCLTEVNVTSPTCVRELDAQFGLNIAGLLFDAIEAGTAQ